MTQPHPQPEYIITETQIKTILILINRDMEMDADEFEIIAKELRSRPHTPAAPATFPNSAELIQMAEMEWHNREERFGLHDKISWTTGWMAGFLTPNKPGLCEMNLEVDTRATILRKVEFDEWLKEHDAAIREQVLTEVIQDIEKMIDAEQERTIEGMYSKEGITK